MKKNYYIACLLCFHISVFSQVGVNTQTPQSTLDVAAKGGVTDKDGLQAPRLTRAQLTSKGNTLYGDAQKGSLVYITDISSGDISGPRANIDEVGYYYFDGSLWQKAGSGAQAIVMSAENGVNATANKIKLGGLLTEPTVISGVNAINKLSVTADGVDAINIDNGTLSIDATNNNVGVGTVTPQKTLHINNALQLANELNVGGNAASAGAAGVAGQILKSNGLGAAPKWENELNIDLTSPTNREGTIIIVKGKLQVAQEIDVRLSQDITIWNGGIQIIGYLTEELMDNKNLFNGTAGSHSFSVVETGLYMIQTNFSLQGSTSGTGGNIRYGLIDTSNNQWVSFAIDTLNLTQGDVRNFSITRVARLESGKSYAFAMSNEGSALSMRGIEGSNGTRVSVFSVKRLN